MLYFHQFFNFTSIAPKEPQLSCSPKQETFIYYFGQRLSPALAGCLNFRLRQAQFAILLINLTTLNKIL